MKTAPFRNQLSFWAFAFIGATGVASCGGDDTAPPATGTASGAVCPTGSTLTYDNFGKNFMTNYCTRCHASNVMGDMRNGAPADHNFDTFAGIFMMAEHIDERAAAGPASVNTLMPPSDPKPTEAERRQLGEWLACETSDDDGGGGGGDGGGGDGGDGGGGRDGGGTPADGNRESTTGSDGSRGGG
jgi:uncharacterized membrane protein